MSKSLIEVLHENKLQVIDSSGGRWVLSCPFHEGDEDPSLTIYPNQTYYCFACGAWGDAVKFLVDYKGLTHEQALAEVGLDHEFPKYKKSKIVKLRDVIGTWKFLGEATLAFHENLKKTPGALNYLHSRGLTDQTIIKYKLGYTDGYVLKYSFTSEYAKAVEAGLIHKDGFELLSHRITIPNILEKNDVDFITGRTVVNNKLKYLNTHGAKPIHGFFEIRKSPIVFLAEGQMDWLILRQWEWPAAVLSGSHLTKSNKLLLDNKQLLFIPDNDAAGKKAVKDIREQFPNITVLDYTEFGFKDISEFAQMKDAERIFTDLIREQANWIFSHSKETLIHWCKPLMRDALFR